MLIEFSVTNFRSFRDTQTLSMVANAGAELRKTNTCDLGVSGIPVLLRSAAIYGPNAGGKSNLLRAMDFTRDFVLESAQDGQEGQPISAEPFLFESATRTAPCEFEVLFVQDRVRYQYGFAVNHQQVTHEWLLAYPEGRAQRWFERQYDPVTAREDWYFGSRFKGRRQLLQEATRSNALFLSTAVQLNNEQLKPVFNWFRRQVAVLTSNSRLSPGFSIKQCEQDSQRKGIVEFMNEADLSIAGIKLETTPFSMDTLPQDMPGPLKDWLEKEMEGKRITNVKFLHQCPNEPEPVALASELESDGTQKLFALAGPWRDTLDRGITLLVDELDASLHPLIMRYLIASMHDPDKNPHNAQLIFTLHHTAILDSELLRRDQVWFMEKDRDNASRLYPLTDFNPRKEERNLEKGYLKGRYGALPFVGDPRF